MKPIKSLLNKYPSIKIVEVNQELDQASFDAQKTKHESRQAEGGAIGTVWLDNETFVLTKRSGMHAGWALIGGTVETGEMFDDAFIREIQEETGIVAKINRVVLLERKIFVSPTNEKLHMDVVLIEAIALEGQRIVETKEASSEGLTLKAFNRNRIPDEMILKDREKLQLLIESQPLQL